MPDDNAAFVSLNLNQVQSDLLKLYQSVACQKGRVEIVDGAGSCECVLISKVELETLEHALELLSDTDDVRALTSRLAELAQAAEPEHAGV